MQEVGGSIPPGSTTPGPSGRQVKASVQGRFMGGLFYFRRQHKLSAVLSSVN